MSATLLGAIVGTAWFLWLQGWWNGAGPAMPLHLWHGHELIFGYGSAAVAGFLLTAVPNWTGSPAANGRFVAFAALLWVAGRVAMFLSGALPPLFVALADLAFLPLLAAQLAVWLIRRPKLANVLFLGLLSLLWLSNLKTHADWAGSSGGGAETGLRAGLLVLCAMISVLGGRITPAFTRNAMMRDGAAADTLPVSSALAEQAALGLAAALPLSVLTGLPGAIAAGAALALGVLQLVRLARWRVLWALRQPILIALHLGIGMLAAGLILWGAAGLGFGDEVAALHVLGIGAVGGMTLAVMSRATLGHSGRPLVAPGPVAVTYVLIPVAAALRWSGGYIGAGSWYQAAMSGAAALWTLAFVLFLAALWPSLTGRRAPAD